MVFGWTQDDGALNAGPGHLIQTEENMIAPIKAFAHAVTDDQFSTLFSLYPAASFEEELQNYRAQSPAIEMTVHYFRVSRILRDLLFTCSSIDFGYQMYKQTRDSLNPGFNGVRLYDLNQSMLTPMFKAVGMPYLGIAPGSDTNYIFNGIFPEGEISPEDQLYSESFAKSLIDFATTGEPSSISIEKESQSWSPTFDEFEKSSLKLCTIKCQHPGYWWPSWYWSNFDQGFCKPKQS
jgi:hypothetical protein